MQNSTSNGSVSSPDLVPTSPEDLEVTHKTLAELLAQIGGQRGSDGRSASDYIFVVHGRDKPLVASLFSLLRALSLNPKGWSEVVHEIGAANPQTGEVIRKAMARAQAIIVLFSPDEDVRLKDHHRLDVDHETGVYGQPRPNVIYEAGFAGGRYPDKTILVQVGKMRPFSDLAGHDILMLSDVSSRNDLANRLANIGCPVSKISNDWMTVGEFKPTERMSRRGGK